MKKLTTFVHHGRIEKGKLVLDNPRYFKGIIGLYDDIAVRVVIERARLNKTRAQLRYLYGVCYELISAHTGYTVEEVDAVMKAKFLRHKLMWRGGDLVTIKDKRELTSDEMSTFIEQVCQEAAELNILIPEADKNWDLKETLTLASELPIN